MGYELQHGLNAVLIAVGLLAVLSHLLAREAPNARRAALAGAGRWVAAGLAGVLLVLGLSRPQTFDEQRQLLSFWGRDGVVEVDTAHRDIYIDGLWHTALSDGTSHLGTPYSWMMAFAAVFSHRDAPIRDILVIGNGIGITAATLAKLEGVHVDAYEINRTLREVLETFPDGTLHVADLDNVTIYWEDARTGMALREKQYDIIISAPLHLRQAGSSLLLSREYMALAKSRLAPGGVFALYSFEGVAAQAVLIKNTVDSLYPYSRTFLNGTLTTASERPIDVRPASVRARFGRDDAFYREVESYHRQSRAMGDPLFNVIDRRVRRPALNDYWVTDDHPLVEYPEIATQLLRRALSPGRPPPGGPSPPQR